MHRGTCSQWLADKRTAYIVHVNWVKKQKKSRMVRDALWFLVEGDTRCDATFDPMASACNKLCYPASYAEPGGGVSRKRCDELNREDDYQSRRHGTRWEKSNHTWMSSLGGQFWHPTAYAALPNCTRNTRKAAPYAAAANDKLQAEEWSRGTERPG
jgi:hypothetical protein